MATKIDADSSVQIQKTVNMTSFFQSRLAETPKKPMPVEVEEEQIIPEKESIC